MKDIDLSDPATREAVLKTILPEQAKQNHDLLKILFKHEMDYREEDEDYDYYENLYWCGFLLFHVGDPADAEMMWEAKYINMDTGTGFDIQTLVGGGVDATIAHLDKHGCIDIADALRAEISLGSFDKLDKWEQSKCRYYYGAQQ